MTSLRLLCTDLDRTLIPNGFSAELPEARQKFVNLISRFDIRLAYVSGRDRQRVHEVIHDYRLPFPDYIIADVGSTIYACRRERCLLVADWHMQIKQDWKEQAAMELYRWFADIPALELQETDKQGRFKLSFYVSLAIDYDALKQQLLIIAAEHHLAVNLIYSIDGEKKIGLLDILPASANKLTAIRYVMNSLGLKDNEVLFAGDSGNDMEVLSSGLPAVLVANAQEPVRQQALVPIPSGPTLGGINEILLAQMESASYFLGEAGLLLLQWKRLRDPAAADALFALAEGNLHNPTLESLWGSSGTLIAVLHMR